MRASSLLLLPLLLASTLARPAPMACEGRAQGQICLGVKWVSYADPSGQPRVSEEAARAGLEKSNEAYAKCGIRFGIEEYQAVQPSTLRLSGRVDSQDDLQATEAAFRTNERLLVVSVAGIGGEFLMLEALTIQQPWPTHMSVMKGDQVKSMDLAHELGHYLTLQHTRAPTNMMYGDKLFAMFGIGKKRSFNDEQCRVMREAAPRLFPFAVR